MKTVYVLGSSYNASFLSSTFGRVLEVSSGHFPTKVMGIPDLLLFAGGIDLCPETYGKKYPQIHGSFARDKWESSWFHWAVEHEVPMFGICRGMQLFTALTGGKLIPHVKGHIGTHNVFVRDDAWTGPNEFNVNSLHHQMCVPPPESKILAWAEGVAFDLENTTEPEALWFPEVRALGVQWHPEMISNGPAFAPAKTFVAHIMREYLNV